jgi:hypothetical protein
MPDPESLAEWSAYAANSSRGTFHALLRACDGGVCRPALLPALGREFSARPNWRVAQHAALEALQSGFLTLAHYWAHHAIKGSAGHALCRNVLAEILWCRRLAGGVLYQAEAMRQLARRTAPRAERRALQIRVAALSARSLAYVGDVYAAGRWLRFLEHTGAVDIDALLAVLFSARQRSETRLQLRAAMSLAPVAPQLGPRPKAAVQASIRAALVRMLRARASAK